MGVPPGLGPVGLVGRCLVLLPGGPEAWAGTEPRGSPLGLPLGQRPLVAALLGTTVQPACPAVLCPWPSVRPPCGVLCLTPSPLCPLPHVCPCHCPLPSLLPPPPPCSLSHPSPLPSLLLHFPSNVGGQGHSQGGLSPAPKGLLGSALGHGEVLPRACGWGWGRRPGPAGPSCPHWEGRAHLCAQQRWPPGWPQNHLLSSGRTCGPGRRGVQRSPCPSCARQLLGQDRLMGACHLGRSFTGLFISMDDQCP